MRALLPEQLQFLISDRGTHFTVQQFAQFAQDVDFVHVFIARHRPASNGIAERFMRTLSRPGSPIEPGAGPRRWRPCLSSSVRRTMTARTKA
jgi:transposase InsO family protein